MSVTAERLEELRQSYLYLQANPWRKERGYSDAMHVEIIEELQLARKMIGLVDTRLALLIRTHPVGDVANAVIAMRDLIARIGDTNKIDKEPS